MSRRSFGPVVLLGIGSGALTAVASNRPWAAVADDSARSVEGAAALAGSTDAQMPLAAALSLVVLAAWGVLLVTRGWVRVGVAGLGLLASAGVVATVLVGYSQTQDALREAFAGVGADDVATTSTGWFVAAAIGSVGSLVSTAIAVRSVHGWPAMGSRYDAPGTRASAAATATAREDGPSDPAQAASGDLWRSIDEGRDPTV
ncbi:Trp biosynthesis-associated membrane protein [Nocardioides donggukensis]|uniref:Trp biosynthesis-associated membrane protein n=1 Tax=Nocardioides donggukensis TaxID=2774019 RepID=A0A927K8Q2_9ACTN|nr:Trp biosynthesis-associated membrane protein [Nocardioides donggukensis]MBD8869710.1 Trp biosynthesis-associated membrane protein [Nocardioides donggukensis]